jgi:hypothetical protein
MVISIQVHGMNRCNWCNMFAASYCWHQSEAVNLGLRTDHVPHTASAFPAVFRANFFGRRMILCRNKPISCGLLNLRNLVKAIALPSSISSLPSTAINRPATRHTRRYSFHPPPPIPFTVPLLASYYQSKFSSTWPILKMAMAVAASTVSFTPIQRLNGWLGTKFTLTALDERTFDRRDRSASPRGDREERNRSRSPRDRP